MEDIIQELKIPPSEFTLEKTYNWYDTKYARVPNIIGAKLQNVKSELKDFTINYSGSGEVIRAISPSEGTYLPVGSTLKIMLGN